MKKAVIIIPTYNEKANINTLIESILKYTQNLNNWSVDILIVDSLSPDGTQFEVEKVQKKYRQLHLLSTKKEGLGQAYINGFKYSFEHLNPFVVFEMDADLSHNPADIPSFLLQIEKGADFVIGSRYIKGGSIPSNWGFHRKLFSIFANLFVRLGFMRLTITDWTDGYRAIKVWVIKKAFGHIENYSGYVFQIAILDSAIINKAHIKEIPIKFIDRKDGVSKINSLQYIVQTFWYVLSHSSFIKFIVVGLMGFVIDFSFAYFFINVSHFPKVQSNMFSAEIAIVCNFFLNNFWSFKHKQIKGGIFTYLKNFVLFNVVSLGSIIIQGGGLWVLLSIFGDKGLMMPFEINVPSWIIYKVIIIAFVIIPYSYFLYNRIVWKNK